jgi:hypothetical protein
MQNSTLKALMNTKDLELTTLRNQLRAAEERAKVKSSPFSADNIQLD